VSPLRLSRLEVAFVVGVPIAWAILLLFHPGGSGTQIYADLNGDGTRMIAVHVGMMVFIPLLALAIWLLSRGLETPAARIGRAALPVFVVFYVAWEALQGIANGILTDQVGALPGGDQELGASLIQDFAESPLVRDLGILGLIGTAALLVAMIATGVALRDAGAPRWTPWALGLAGFLISAHPPPMGPTGLALFAATVIVLMRSESGQAATAKDDRSMGTQKRGFDPYERAYLIGVPVCWALFLLLHPTGDGEDFYPIVSDEVTAWMTVHLATLVFVPLMAGVVLLMLRGVRGAPATVSRAAVGVFAVVYMAWEVLIGIGTGVLVDQVNQLEGADQAAGAALVEAFTDSGFVAAIEPIGTGAWIVALCGAGIALVRERGVPVAVPILLVLSAIPTAWHVFPFGQAGLLLFIAAMIILLRATGKEPRSQPRTSQRSAYA
jgi:hypothetical protein